MTKAEIKARIKARAGIYWTKKGLATMIGARSQSVSVAFDEMVNDGEIRIVGMKGKAIQFEDNTAERINGAGIKDIASVEEVAMGTMLKVKGTKVHMYYNRKLNDDGSYQKCDKDFVLFIGKEVVDQLKEIKDSEVPFF